MKKKLLALLLAAATVFSAVPSYVRAEEPETYDIVAHYDMSHSDTKLLDQSGKGNDAVLHNISSSDFKEELGDTFLELPGGNAGADGSYIDLPLSIKDSLTDYKEGFSVEIALIPRTAQYQFLWTIGTGDSTDYLFFNPRLASGNINVAIKTQGANNAENSIPGSGNVILDTKTFSVLTVTSEGQRLKLYVNGELKGTLDHSHDLDEVFRGNGNVLGYIAKSNWGADRYCDAIVTDFKIYNQTLTDAQVKAIYDGSNYVYASQLIEDDIAAVDLGNLSAVTEDMTLPAAGSVNGSVITWKSGNTDIISDEGKVTPADETTKVELTATFSLSGVSVHKTYSAYVIGKNDKADIILEQYLNLSYYITAEDTLPLEILGTEVSWTSDCEDIDTETGKITPSKEGITDVGLTASVTLDGKKKEKKFQVKLLGTDSAYVLSYTREADASKDGMYNDYVSDNMHLGYSEDGEDYRALLNNTGVLFAKAQGETTKLLKEPYIFRMKDGSFGVLAVRVTQGETAADEVGTLLFFTSKDLLSYTEVGMIWLDDTERISNPACVYDAVEDSYRITWTGLDSRLSYANVTKDFQTFTEAEVSAPIQAGSVETDIPYAIPGNTVGITEEEGTHLLNKLDKVVNTTVENPAVTTKVGETVDLADIKVTANYSDGSSAEKMVLWNEEELAAVDFDTEGTYTVTGKVRQISDQTDENDPFIERRADPTITEYNGKYYFIATTEAAVDNNYGLYIREADTITGLNQAEEHLVFNKEKAAEYGYDAPTNHWAPELHVLDGELYMFFSVNLGSGFNVQSMLMKLTGDDPTNYDDWGDLHQFLNKDGNPLTEPYGGITLDMTHFSYGGRDYVAWSQRNFGKNGGTADLWIGEIDRSKPYQLISDAVKFVNCEYGWERNHTFVTEGPNTIFTDDKLYLTYSGGATDETYCVGVTTIDLNENTDFLDPSAWTKCNYPVLTGLSVEGLCGPGHNSYVKETDGTLINVYHAKKGIYGSRDTFLRIVHFGADGAPILDMTEENEILPENKTVTMTVKVEKAATPDPDPQPTPDPTPDPDPQPTPNPKLPYVDVAEGDWFYNEVAYNYYEEIMTGMDPTHFEPYTILPRAQFATILYRMNGEPGVTYTAKFPDVPDKEFYSNAVLWAAEAKVVTGYTDSGYFGTNDPITREQMAVMMYRYANYKGYSTGNKADFDSFKDADKVNAFAEEAMAWAVGNGIITGKYNGIVIDPQGNATRAECAIILTRFLDKIAK